MTETTYNDLVAAWQEQAAKWQDPAAAIVASESTMRRFIAWLKSRHNLTVQTLDRGRPPIHGVPMLTDNTKASGIIDLLGGDAKVAHRYRLVGDRLVELPLNPAPIVFPDVP